MKVVVIDDSAMVLDVVCAGLEARGYNAVPLDSPIGAGIVVTREKPDAVLVDLTMASMSGEAVVKSLKTAAPDGPRVVLFSDRQDADIALAAARSGADGWVRKGDMDRVAAALAKAIGR